MKFKETLAVTAFLYVAAIFCLTPNAFAQLETGISDQFASYSSEGFDTINLSNLNSHFSIPIVNKNGRKLGFYYNLQYDSLIWQPTVSGSSTEWMPISNGSSNWGWSLDTDVTTGRVTASTVQYTCVDGAHQFNTNVWQEFVYYDPSGSPHSVTGYIGGCLTGYSGGPGPYQTTFTSTTTDGSGFTVTASGLTPAMTVISRSGIKTQPPFNVATGSGSVADSNSNQITIGTSGGFTDSTGNTVLTIAGSASSPPRTYTYPVVGGSNAPPVTVNYSPYYIRTHFQCSGITEFHYTDNYSANLVSSIVLPDGGGTYSFTYEVTPNNSGYTTGRIATITLPTGGEITYTYAYPSSGCLGGTQSDGSGYKITRTTSDSHSTIYDRSTPSQTVVTTGDGTVTTVSFAKWFETKRTRTISTGTFTTATCYNGSVPPNCTTGPSSGLISEVTKYTTLDNGYESEVDQFFGTTYGETLKSDEYDYGNGVVGGFLREIAMSYNYGTTVPVELSDVSVWSAKNGGGTHLYDTRYSYDSNGNLNGITQGPSGTGNPQLTITANINTYGLPTYTTNSSNQQTNYSYDSTHTFLTTATLPTTTANNSSHTRVPHSVSPTVDVYTGLLTASEDDNSNSTGYTYDSLWRPHQVTYPDGGEKWYEFSTTNLIKVESKISSAYTSNSETLLDGFGRTISTGTFVSTNTWNRQDTCYDNMGRVHYVSSAYSWTGTDLAGPVTCPSTTAPGDTYAYDGLSRVTAITHVDGSELQYQYKGRATNIIEESNGAYSRNRILQYDGIGRLTDVCEVFASSDSITVGAVKTPSNCGLDLTGSGLNGFHTTYGYDLLGDLTSVTQSGVGAVASCGTSSRCWTYDTLQRVTQEVTPEAGTIKYQYVPQNSNGAGKVSVMTRPAPNNVTSPASTVDTDYAYDEWGRLVTRNYFYTGHPTSAEPNTPVVNFLYDVLPGWGSSATNPKSNLTETWTAMPASLSTTVTASSFDYDSMGRVLHNGQCTPNTCSQIPTSTPFLITYLYNYVGEPTSFVNSVNGVTLTYSYDTAARLWQLVSSRTGANYPATLLSLAKSGGGVQYGPYGPTGDTLGNGIVETFSYGNPASGQIPFLNGITATKSSTTKYSLSLGVSSNGFVNSAADSVNGTWSYSYDSLDRLKTASESGTAMNWQYDVAGNRWNQNATVGNPPQPQYDFTGNGTVNNNKIDSATYDVMGNMLKDFATTPNTYTYDAEGRVYQVNGGTTATYAYDAGGRRVKGPSYEYVFDLAGRPASVLNGSTDADVADELYAGGRHVASYFGSGTYFVNSDHLGTERVRTDASANVCQTMTNLPYGDLQTFTTNTCSDADGRSIGGMEFDPETGLEHTLFRKYYSNPGRSMTPDPAGTVVAVPSDPQTWNRYSYVTNNPTSSVDPLGLERIGPGECDASVVICAGGGLFGGEGGLAGFGGWDLDGLGGVPWGFGPGYAWGANSAGAWMAQAEAAYLSYVNAVFASLSAPNGAVAVSMNVSWNMQDGAYGINGVNGSIIDAEALQELWGLPQDTSGELSPPQLSSSSNGSPQFVTVGATSTPYEWTCVGRGGGWASPIGGACQYACWPDFVDLDVPPILNVRYSTLQNACANVTGKCPFAVFIETASPFSTNFNVTGCQQYRP